LNSTGVSTYNCGNRASWISVGFATPSYQEALPSCLRPAAITRSRLPFDTHPSRSERQQLLTPLVPRVHLPVSLAGPAPSGSSGASRRCRGCSPPDPADSPGPATPCSCRPAATGRRRGSHTRTRIISASWRTVSHPHSKQQRLVAHPLNFEDPHFATPTVLVRALGEQGFCSGGSRPAAQDVHGEGIAHADAGTPRLRGRCGWSLTGCRSARRRTRR
jgi:hypothetical protein